MDFFGESFLICLWKLEKKSSADLDVRAGQYSSCSRDFLLPLTVANLEQEIAVPSAQTTREVT
jgi:hypothetical protein